MAQDIEEFLRMAAARKKQQGQGRQQGQAPAQPPQQPQQRPPQQQQPQQQRPKRQQDQHQLGSLQSTTESAPQQDVYYVDEPVEDIPNLQSSIRSSVSTTDISEHASHLGSEVHDRHVVNERVESKFDHGLGRLKKDDLGVPDVIDHGRGLEDVPDVSKVLNMLKQPNSLKQAIILKEIFERPDF